MKSGVKRIPMSGMHKEKPLKRFCLAADLAPLPALKRGVNERLAHLGRDADDVDPFAFANGDLNGVHDGLDLQAFAEAGDAIALLEDCVDEFDVLIVAKGDERVPCPWVAG